MSSDAASFIGNIPQHYDQGLGPIIFAEYAADIARRAAASRPARVLETAAGTGIVTRRLRDALPGDTQLTATDLNPPMLDMARAKFRPGEQVGFQPADAVALPFADQSFDAIVCQFGVMFFPDKAKSFVEAYRVLAPGGRYVLSVWDFSSIQSVWSHHARGGGALLPRRSAAVLQRAVLLPPDRSDQAIPDRSRVRRHRHRRDQTAARAPGCRGFCPRRRAW